MIFNPNKFKSIIIIIIIIIILFKKAIKESNQKSFW